MHWFLVNVPFGPHRPLFAGQPKEFFALFVELSFQGRGIEQLILAFQFLFVSDGHFSASQHS